VSVYVIAWIVVAAAFVVAEALTTQLIGIWFAVGAVVALLFELIGAPGWLQFLAFAVSAAILLALTRPLVRRFISSRAVPTNADRAIGEIASVLADIRDGETGQVKVNGQVWSAIHLGIGVIRAGERVTVREIRGVKLVVEPIKEGVK
jgi:membrane protein implicated in regulation of membrane protease activity